jgi:hypothetical protein
MSKPDELGAIVMVGGCEYMICDREDAWHEMHVCPDGSRQVSHEITLTIQKMHPDSQWHTPTPDEDADIKAAKRAIKRKKGR